MRRQVAENCWCDNDLRKCGESYLLFVEVLEQPVIATLEPKSESYLLFVEVLEPRRFECERLNGESHLMFVEVLELS